MAIPQTESEDWNFARKLHRLGCKVMSTRLVSLDHMGVKNYRNDCVWGKWETDLDCMGFYREEAARRAAESAPV